MPDIFSRKSTYQNSFSADDTILTIQGIDVGLIAQSIDVSYVQQITRLYEVGSSNTYFVAGRTQGGMGIQQVVGPKSLTKAFYENFGDVCNAANNNISLSAALGCGSPDGSAESTEIYLNQCVITEYGLGVRAETALIMSSTKMIFNTLSFEG